MKPYEFLIILGFIQIVFCNHDSNITDDLDSMCPINLIRRKREKSEYIRWRVNLESTNAFLVKVFDEDLSTPTVPIVAVNIVPATRNDAKIVVGGVSIPLPTTIMSTTSELVKGYTRFIPPTSAEVHDANFDIATPLYDDVENTIMQQQDYHPQRDDSPPASPQFIARSPPLVDRQYAPLEPVAFSRHNNIMAPITPPTLSTLYAFNDPSHSSLKVTTLPPRTEVKFLTAVKFKPFEESATRIIHTPAERTTIFQPSSLSDGDNFITTSTKLFHDNRKHIEAKQVSQKDSDQSYNMLFYNDDDAVGDNKKHDREEGHYGKKEDEDSDASDQVDQNGENANETNVQVSDDYADDSDFDNDTTKCSSEKKKIDAAIKVVKLRNTEEQHKQRPYCSLLKIRELNFNSPRTLAEIVKQMKYWAENSPLAKWVDITHGNYTTMENSIYMMIIDDPSSGQIVTAKQTVMIVAGIQGRDHHAVSAALYVMYQLIERSEAHTDLLTKYRFWIIPVFNPDGYDYSMTFPQRREWTKNLRQEWDPCPGREVCKSCESHGIRCTMQTCYGVNLDRNFEYQWISAAEELRAEHPCGRLYAGPRQLSEVETRALTQFLHEQRTPLFTFIAFKEGQVLGIMYPYSHTKKHRAFDHVYRQRASRAAAAAYSISNRPYVAGQTSEFLPLYAGGIEDWVDGHLGIDNTYSIMMFRPSDSYNTKLIIERVVHETYAAMDTLLLQSIEPVPSPSVKTVGVRGAGIKATSTPLMLIVTVYAILLINGLIIDNLET